jgi:hypothetical protein
MQKSKFATVILSIVPGVGHLYLGWMERGLQFMLAFVLSLFLMEWLSLSLFAYLLPVIWFYSLFDALNLLSYGGPAQEARPPWAWLAEHQRWVGIGLIALGALTLINRMVVPYLHQYWNFYNTRMINASVIAILLIAGGIRLALGKQAAVAPDASEKQAGQIPVGTEEEN